MADEEMLLDTYRRTSSSWTEWENACNELASQTLFPTIDLSKCTLYIFNTEDGEKIRYKMFSQDDDVEELLDYGGAVSEISLVFDEPVSPTIKDTLLKRQKGMLFSVDRIKEDGSTDTDFYILSRKAIASLLDRCRASCPLFLEQREEVQYLVGLLLNVVFSGRSCKRSLSKCATRRVNGLSVIFYVGSNNFSPHTEKNTIAIAKEFLKKFPSAEWKTGEVGQDYTCAEFQFPQIAEEIKKNYGLDIMPGARIFDSAIGRSSVILEEGYYKNGIFLTTKTYSMKHTAPVDAREFIEKASKHVLVDLYWLPKQLLELSRFVVTSSTISSEEQELRFFDCIESVTKKCFRRDDLTKQRKQIIEERAKREFHLGEWTAKDIFLVFWKILEDMNAAAASEKCFEDIMNKMRKGVFNILSFNFSKWEKEFSLVSGK